MGQDLQRILVVSWVTKDCQKAVHQGISLARKYNAELTILHVIHNPFGLKGWNVPLVSLEKEYRKLFTEAKADLDRIVGIEKGKGLHVKEIIKEGEPQEEILKVVREGKIDLLISMHYEDWRFEHFLFCRNIEKLIHKMPCSIMLVRHEIEPVSW
jgi:universal stress protein A